jgi:hypothetical protein
MNKEKKLIQNLLRAEETDIRHRKGGDSVLTSFLLDLEESNRGVATDLGLSRSRLSKDQDRK